MPARNTIREYDAPAYYHVYNRGAGGAKIFQDSQDKYKFISLLERYLSNIGENTKYPSYDLELLAYCVMGNHFHLLIFHDTDPFAVTKLLRSVSTTYAMYYNLKYKSHGHVFQSVFKASRITDESYLQHLSRYIHLNPETYKTYKWSSLRYYMGQESPPWLNCGRLNDLSPGEYGEFLEDYVDKRRLLKEISDQLAI